MKIRSDAKNMIAVLALFEQPHPLGFTTDDIRRLVPQVKPATSKTCVQSCLSKGRLVKYGPRVLVRYFRDAAALAAAQPAVDALNAKLAAAQAEKTAARRREHDRTKWAKRYERIKATTERLAPPPPRPARAFKPAGERPGVVMAGEIRAEAEASVLRKAKPASVRKVVEVIIPDHVKVQVLPGYQGDPRMRPDTPSGGFGALGIGRYL